MGAGGLARDTAVVIDAVGAPWTIAGFAAAAEEAAEDMRFGPILGDDDFLIENWTGRQVTIAVGQPAIRQRVVERYDAPGRFEFPNFLHPTMSYHEPSVRFGRGNVVAAGALLTTEITIGDFNWINLGVTIGHDAKIGNSNVINPGANISGYVEIGDGVLVGTGAQILERIRVGDGATVAAGAAVTKDVEPGTTVWGVPARPLRPPAS